MPRLNTAAPPNKALQRTRSAPLRSPLSFETLGDGREAARGGTPSNPSKVRRMSILTGMANRFRAQVAAAGDVMSELTYRSTLPETLPPPNNALQRTRSAPLRSPLSFETLGDGSNCAA